MKNGTNINVLSNENIEKIYSLYRNRKNEEEKAYLATYDEIKENDYNISVNTYLRINILGPEINIEEVNKQVKEIVEKQSKTRNELDNIINELESDFYE